MDNEAAGSLEDGHASSPVMHDLLVKYMEFVSGSGAATVNILVTFPVNKIIFRQQRDGVRARTAAAQVLLHDGFVRIYRGVLPPLLMKATSYALMFGMFDKYSNYFSRAHPDLPRPLCTLLASLLAGWTEAVLTPFERVQVLLQDRHYHSRFQNTRHVTSHIYRSYGGREFYRGLTPILIRNGLSNFLFFSCRRPLKAHLLPHAHTPLEHLFSDFASGALLGASISTVFFPVNAVKAHMQCVLGGPYTSFLTTLWRVYRQRGLGVFRGISLNFTRSLISWGIVNASYEFFRTIISSETRL